MKCRLLLICLILLVASFAAIGQTQPSEKDIATANELFQKANSQLENKEYRSALSNYEAALKVLPDEPALLYNGGFAALLANENEKAVQMLSRIKVLDPEDWQSRAKLIQAYQRLDKVGERDKEREELLLLRKGGKVKGLSERIEYCRDRFDAGGKSVLAFELFEFKAPRGVRYVFSMISDQGKEEYRISLGSYDTTNSIWRETTKPTPREGVRLFHLDGYFPNGHATYGMMVGEPSYEATKKMVVDILEKKAEPISSSTIALPKP